MDFKTNAPLISATGGMVALAVLIFTVLPASGRSVHPEGAVVGALVVILKIRTLPIALKTLAMPMIMGITMHPASPNKPRRTPAAHLSQAPQSHHVVQPLLRPTAPFFALPRLELVSLINVRLDATRP